MKNSESLIQFQIFQWHWNNYPDQRGLLFAVPNGGFRNPREAAQLKATGTVKGVADLIYFAPDGKTYAFEIKTATGRQTLEQQIWEQKIKNAGVKYFICRNLTEFQNIFLSLSNQ